MYSKKLIQFFSTIIKRLYLGTFLSTDRNKVYIYSTVKYRSEKEYGMLPIKYWKSKKKIINIKKLKKYEII